MTNAAFAGMRALTSGIALDYTDRAEIRVLNSRNLGK